MFLVNVCSLLEKEGIPYAVVGGHAVALHGAIRGTVDIDIVIGWSLQNLEKIEQLFEGLGLVPRLPLSAAEIYHKRNDFITHRNLLAWSFHNPKNPLEQLDVLLNFDLGENAVKTISSSHGNITIINIDTLIAMKRASGRPQDLEDIKALERLR